MSVRPSTGPAHRLLRSGVADRADELPGLGQAADRARVLGEAEVREIGMVERHRRAPMDQQHVGRLDVAVNQAPFVSGAERARDLGADRDRALDLERAVRADQPAQIRILDLTHGDEQEAVGLACVVDRDDVGVVDARRDPRLAQEALAEAVVLAELDGEDLQRHRPVEADVLGEVDDRHAAARKQRLEPVTGDLRPDPRRLTHRSDLPSRLRSDPQRPACDKSFARAPSVTVICARTAQSH